MVLANANPQPNKQRSRKRKNQPLKMICEMNAQKLLEDPWAWRKYGQKPIKGSPYPRSYYRCSSARECGAKKLVEKSHTNENTFLVTYTGEHNHEKPINRIMVSTPSWNKPPETRLLPAGVVGPSQNIVSPNAMLWFDQPESGNSPIHGGNAQVNNDDNIVLVPNMMAVSETSLMNFNPLNIGNIPFVESNP
uniref:Probable WRKY transcription factor 27 n=2 Tax=Cicer arietinum TaxID=3827 RepID=A0A1S2Z832_CICAR|nr:probable WRKY transcription factor 27 [Cicer arietinum]